MLAAAGLFWVVCMTQPAALSIAQTAWWEGLVVYTSAPAPCQQQMHLDCTLTPALCPGGPSCCWPKTCWMQRQQLWTMTVSWHRGCVSPPLPVAALTKVASLPDLPNYSQQILIPICIKMIVTLLHSHIEWHSLQPWSVLHELATPDELITFTDAENTQYRWTELQL